MFKEVNSENEMKILGETIGKSLRGGEVIELIGDLGSGKTTFVKGVAVGLGIELGEVLSDPQTVTVIEWGGVVNEVLPSDRLSVNITTESETARRLEFCYGGSSSQSLAQRVKQ